MMVEVVTAHGHPNIRAEHPTTFEITREEEVTLRGDCIIGVGADKALCDLDKGFREILRRDGSLLLIFLEAGGARDLVVAHGSGRLVLGDCRRIIVRRSGYVEPATLAIYSSKAARHIDRGLVEALRRGSMLRALLVVLEPDEIESINIAARRVLENPPPPGHHPSLSKLLSDAEQGLPGLPGDQV